MNRKSFHPSAIVWGAALVFALMSVAMGQFSNNNQQTSTQTSTAQNTSLRSVPAGSKMKFRGVVITRDADVFTIRDRSRADYQVVITDNTSIKTHGGIFTLERLFQLGGLFGIHGG